ncbi:MAG: hypothetical protein LBE75_00740 [Burkholderiales bacterium]|jgi:hypothetical protein|nr:hypothetical protein [Burkholderiales bacterium]
MKRCHCAFLILCSVSLGVNAQIYKCSLPGERVVYSDSKCDPLASGGRLKITDNLMDSPGSKREANLTTLRASRLNHQAQVPYLDANATESVKGGRWDGSGETFMIYSPLLGPGMYFDR